MKVYVFDIDGTICNSENGAYEKAKPLESRIKKINKLYKKGNTIIFNTARGMGRYGNSYDQAYAAFYNLTVKQLDLWGVKYHKLFLGKPAGDLYVDDKGISDENFFNARD